MSNAMRRIAATLAGLALVAIPSTIAMGSADSSSSAKPTLTPYEQVLQQSAPSSGHRGRDCPFKHRKKSLQREGASDV